MFGEVERQTGAVVHSEAVHVHKGEKRRCAEEVLEVEAAPRARADEVDGVRPHGFKEGSQGSGVAEGTEEYRVRRGRVGDGAGAVGGHEDHVLSTDDLRRVLFGEGTVIVALYPR